MRPQIELSSAPAPFRAPRTFALFFAVVVLAAAAMFLNAAPTLAPPPWLTLALVWGLMLASEMSPIPLPSGGYATASAVFDLPGLVILGPVYTALLDVASTLLIQGLVLRRRPIKVIFNVACFAVTDFAAGYAFQAAGGHVGQLRLQHDVLPLLACGGAYFLVNS